MLNKNGAEIYLITSTKPNKLKKINKKSKKYNQIYLKEMYSSMTKGVEFREDFKSNNNYKLKLIIKLLINLVFLFKNNFIFRYEIFYQQNSKLIKKIDPRLDYLKDIKGFIWIKKIFHISRLRSMRLLIKDPELNLEKNKIDLIISTSPLSLKFKNSGNAEIVQFIHDAIPLCVSNPVENRRTFYNKLLDAHNHCKCIYVSKESKRVVSKILNINNADNLIINPLPSLNKDDLKKAYNIENIKNIDRQFILLNSSIVETKRVEKAIYYFLKSNLTKRNFLFCIAGKLHNSSYCDYIKYLCKGHDNILLLDYVDELEKAWLFLNSSLLISTTKIEGFGIPVLDGLSIGLPTLATSIPSHHEIKAIKKNNFIKLINQEDERTWIDLLNQLNIFEINNLKLRYKRLNFFKHFIKEYEEKTLDKFVKILEQK